MAVEIPDDIPASFRAGDTAQWTKDLSDYPSTEYSATYYFVKAALTSDKNRYDAVSTSVASRGTETHSVSASADGSGGYSITIAASSTAGWRAGRYKWALKVTQIADSTIKYTVEEGQIDVLPDISAQTSSYDDRTKARLIVEQIDAIAVEMTKPTNKVKSYSVAGRTFQYRDYDELMKMRARYVAIARIEEGKGPQTIEVTF